MTARPEIGQTRRLDGLKGRASTGQTQYGTSASTRSVRFQASGLSSRSYQPSSATDAPRPGYTSLYVGGDSSLGPLRGDAVALDAVAENHQKSTASALCGCHEPGVPVNPLWSCHERGTEESSSQRPSASRSVTAPARGLRREASIFPYLASCHVSSSAAARNGVVGGSIR
jgi:hypothetical protein